MHMPPASCPCSRPKAPKLAAAPVHVPFELAMATAKAKKKALPPSSCECPEGSKRVLTKGRGRGWACQGPKRGKYRPFVAAICKGK